MVPKQKQKPAPVPPELLAAVLANPEDEGARQVYADALIERGDPRGEFITVQCEIARRGGKPTAATKKLRDRSRALHSRHSGKWAKSLRALGKRISWEHHRGFVRRLRLLGIPSLAAFREVLATEPVTELVHEYATLPWLRSALAVPGAERLRRLSVLFTDPPHADNLAKLVVAAGLPNLEHLRIGRFGDTPTTTLANGPLPSLRHLAIGGGGHGVHLTARGVAALAKSAVGAQLEVLELGWIDVTPEIVKLVIGMKHLKTVSLSRGSFSKTDRAALEERFGVTGFVVEDEPGFDYLLDGVYKLSRNGARK